jgi:hypothetical protein
MIIELNAYWDYSDKGGTLIVKYDGQHFDLAKGEHIGTPYEDLFNKLLKSFNHDSGN